MNYLAHIYLSGNDREVQLGNFIADSIKGKQLERYGIGIQKGIRMHRAIDYFTDTHPLVKKGGARLFPTFRHYHLVLMDMFYDHFLAKNWCEYSESSLADFAQDFYRFLEIRTDDLPLRNQKSLPYLIEENWLVKYAELDGLAYILKQMTHRIQYKVELWKGVDFLVQFYAEYENEFHAFFEDLQLYVRENPDARW
ncbi:MAG: ACP phosphodiesterase [Flavobacteriaceae bacterium]|nr:ACP phosphodiesterase [Flavobacteriaceae bacterium]